MEAEPESSVEAAQERQVPEDLLQKLHDATERFHTAKKSLDAAMDGAELGHDLTIERATDDMRTVEREVEQISMQIHSSLKPPPTVNHNH